MSIKFEHTEVMNFEGAIRGMRNPLNSWDKSDSGYYNQCDECYALMDYSIGRNDLNLMRRLANAGSDHRKFLRQILVSVDITAPLYWWKEFDTYKVGTVANSCSTMHKIQAKPIELSDFSCEYCPGFTNGVVETLEGWRRKYLETKNKEYWYAIIQLLPESYNQKRTVTLNYEVLRNIRNSDRKTHKLDEWRVGFMDWIDSLPYAEDLLIDRR